MRARRGFSLVEMVLAIGLLGIVILSVGLLSLMIIRSTSESNDRTSTAAVASSLLDRVIRDAQDDPNFWSTDHVSSPYLADTLKMGKLNYQYEVFAETLVNQNAGNPVGDALANNRLKRVTLLMSWHDTQNAERQGYGKLSYSVSRVVNENP